jgi:hypothetical protein
VREPGNTPTPPGGRSIGQGEPSAAPGFLTAPSTSAAATGSARISEGRFTPPRRKRRSSCPAEWSMSFRARGRPNDLPILSSALRRLDAGQRLVDLDDLQRDTGLSREQVWAGLRALETAELGTWPAPDSLVDALAALSPRQPMLRRNPRGGSGFALSPTRSEVRCETSRSLSYRRSNSVSPLGHLMGTAKMAEPAFFQSGRRDLNSGPLVPQTSALTRLRHAPRLAPS